MNCTRNTIVAVVAVAAWTLTGSASARADGPPYDFKLKLAADQQWSFEQTSTMSMQASSGGQQFTQSMNQKKSGSVTILTAKDGIPTAMEVAFSPDSGQSMSMNGQSQDKPSPVAGKTLRIKKDELGIVEIDGIDADQPTTAELTQMLTPDRSLFPSHAVNVGDQWAGDSAAMAKQMGWGPNDKVSVTCKLTKIGTAGGRPTADVAVTLTGTQDAPNGVVTKMTMEGIVQTDLATGQTLQADLSGKMELSGQANGPQGPVAVQGEGKLELHQTAKPTAGVPAVGPVAAGGGAGTTVGDANPLGNGGAPAVNPLSPAGDAADKFVGTFKGDKLSLQLSAAGRDGSYAGMIIMGTRKFSALARADGAKLTGTFESGGNKFDFSATLDGSSLTLKSGQTEYALKKDVPANPLDTGGPVNPLGQ